MFALPYHRNGGKRLQLPHTLEIDSAVVRSTSLCQLEFRLLQSVDRRQLKLSASLAEVGQAPGHTSSKVYRDSWRPNPPQQRQHVARSGQPTQAIIKKKLPRTLCKTIALVNFDIKSSTTFHARSSKTMFWETSSLPSSSMSSPSAPPQWPQRDYARHDLIAKPQMTLTCEFSLTRMSQH